MVRMWCVSCCEGRNVEWVREVVMREVDANRELDMRSACGESMVL
jgi:hypothetical protein